MACNEGVKLISSTKQTVIQGVHTAKPYVNYLFEITLSNTVDLRVDSVFIYKNTIQYKVNHTLVKFKNNKKYKLEASLNEGNYTSSVVKNEITNKDKAVIYYRIHKKSGTLNVSTFKEETVTRR